MIYEGFQLAEVREKIKFKNFQIRMFDFHGVAKNIKGWLKIYTLFLVCSQIWLNLPTGWSPLFLHLHMDENQFGYKQKFSKKQHCMNQVLESSRKPELSEGAASSRRQKHRSLKRYGKSTRHWTGSGTPAPSNSTSVRFWQKHAAPTVQRSASIRPKGISIEYADLMHFWWSFLFVGLLHAFAIPRLLQAVLVLDPPTDWRACRPWRLGKFDQLLT